MEKGIDTSNARCLTSGFISKEALLFLKKKKQKDFYSLARTSPERTATAG
jgi:hypothetical protein